MNNIDLELKKHKFIIVAPNHYNMLGMCRSLGEKGIEPIVVTFSDPPILYKNCKYVKSIVIKENNDACFEYVVKTYCNEIVKPFILVGHDGGIQWLDNHYDELKDKFYFFNGSQQGRINYYMDKNNICNLAEKCGIPKPKGETLKHGELPKTLKYPVITKVTKSTKGAWKQDVHICQNEQELLKAWPLIKAEEMLVQEFIVKKNEICLDGFSINEGEEVWLQYTSEYIRFTDLTFGDYMWFKPFTDQNVIDSVKKILKETHFTGVFSVEMLLDKNDNHYFLEVNFRNSTWSYAYTYAGLNLPYLWAKSTIQGHIDYNDAKPRKEPFRGMVEMDYFVNYVRTGEISVFRYIKEVMTCDMFFYFNKYDQGVFWYIVKKNLRRLFHLS